MMMIWTMAWLCFSVGVLAHYIWVDLECSSAIKQWRANRRKFTCDACKVTKRAKDGFSPLSLDLEYGDELLPLNLRLCKDCAPNA